MEKEIPEFLEEMLEKQYGKELTNKIIDGYSKKRYTTFRVNNLKSTIEEVEKILNDENIQYEKINWYENAFIIKNVDESRIRNLKLYDEGKIYMQSLSSMLPPIILDAKEKEDILDMTAAPGGKTTEIAALTENKANITACEMNKIRCEKLKFNIKKQSANVFVMNQDARKIDDFFSFDKILLDAPCSGSGTLNVNDDLEKMFTKELIAKSIKSQKVLIDKAIKILKKGKEMVYSTCSILDVENEEIIKEVLKQNKVEIVPIENEGLNTLPLLPTKLNGTICVCPNQYYEGFFIAKLKKK